MIFFFEDLKVKEKTFPREKAMKKAKRFVTNPVVETINGIDVVYGDGEECNVFATAAYNALGGKGVIKGRACIIEKVCLG